VVPADDLRVVLGRGAPDERVLEVRQQRLVDLEDEALDGRGVVSGEDDGRVVVGRDAPLLFIDLFERIIIIYLFIII
jgi:hypothetical protein